MNRHLAIGIAALGVVGIAVVFLAGSYLSWPVRREVGDPPPDLRAVSVQFPSESGATIAAWLGLPRDQNPVIVMSHGFRGTRIQLSRRAQFLRDQGYGVLLYDSLAHGESTGDHITFGYLEAFDAQAAVTFAAARCPDSKIGFLGPSLAGASALLGADPLPVEALVLEAVYQRFESAVYKRIAIRTGSTIAKVLTPLLLMQVEPRLGFDPYDLNPIERVGAIETPILFIAGSIDPHPSLAESMALFTAARGPKERWLVEGAGHENYHDYASAEYEKRVSEFFGRHLLE